MIWDKYKVFTMKEGAAEDDPNAVTEWSLKGIIIQSIIYALLLLTIGVLAGYSLAKW